MFGYPVRQIRRLMRIGATGSWGEDFVAANVGIEKTSAGKLVKALLAAGLIAKVDRTSHGQTYELTINGRALGMASAAKPIKRATADRYVSELLQRVEQVNNDPDLLFWVDEVVVFGSYLTNSPSLGDVDLAVMYTRRIGRSEWLARSKERLAIARANGRSIGKIEGLGWPQTEIELRLRKGSRALHIHDLSSEREFIETIPHQSIYLRQPVVCPACNHVVTTSKDDSLNAAANLEDRVIVPPASFDEWCRRVLNLGPPSPDLLEDSPV